MKKFLLILMLVFVGVPTLFAASNPIIWTRNLGNGFRLVQDIENISLYYKNIFLHSEGNKTNNVACGEAFYNEITEELATSLKERNFIQEYRRENSGFNE